MEAASKDLSIGENVVRKFEFLIKREQVYRVYPKNLQKNYFSQKTQNTFSALIRLPVVAGVNFGWVGG